MTGGLGFVKDGMNSQRNNRRILKGINARHFQTKHAKSDFSRKFASDKIADKNTIDLIRAKAKIERKARLIRSAALIIITVAIVVFIYYLPFIIEYYSS
ncbi:MULTISPECIES: hypothetical protein [unclassified Carboxylicivirga]|uniref:hypothetical protein n=1 Tax=Carboxylicivirga TaxID=1628153 RepID=UPI003D341C0E